MALEELDPGILKPSFAKATEWHGKFRMTLLEVFGFMVLDIAFPVKVK